MAVKHMKEDLKKFYGRELCAMLRVGGGAERGGCVEVKQDSRLVSE